MPVSKLLVIRLSSAGDIILTSPLLKIIKEREPDTEIHFVIKSIYSDLVRHNPNIITIHLVQEHADINQLEELRQHLIKEKFDSTLDLHNNFRSIYLRRETSRDIRVIKKEIFKRAMLVNMKLNFYTKPRPVALKYARVYDESLNDVPRPEIFYPDNIRDRIDKVWSDSGPEGRETIFLCPGARHFTKRWPMENWKKLAETLATKYHVVLVGGKEDVKICSFISGGSHFANFCGSLSMLESAAILSHADLVITNDSFLMHAANALGRKTLAVFGSSVKEFGFFPYGVENRVMEVNELKCRPCSHIGRESCPKDHFRCMIETTPEMVHEAAMEMMKK